MTKCSHRIFITLATLCMVSGLDQYESKYKLKNNKKLRETFNDLLRAVTSVNEERLGALKKFYELQTHLPKVGRTDDKFLAVIIPNTNKYDPKRDDNDFYETGPNIEPGGTSELLQIFKGTDDSADDESLRIDSDDNSTSLRQWKGCKRSAAKHCKKACQKAFKEVCSDYKCSRSMRKSGKRSCRRVCNNQFGNDGVDDYY